MRLRYSLSVVAFAAITALVLLPACGDPPQGGEGESVSVNEDDDSFDLDEAADVAAGHAELEGFVVGDDGEPVGGGVVEVEHHQEGRFYANTVGDDGYFLIGGAQEGLYTIEYEGDADIALGGGLEGISVSLTTGERKFHALYESDDVTVDPDRDWSRPNSTDLATLDGIVVDDDGEPVSNVLVSGFLAGSEIDEGFATFTDDNGEFVIIGIWPGTYTVFAEQLSGDPADVREMTFSGGASRSVTLDLSEVTDEDPNSQCPAGETLVEMDGERFCTTDCDDDHECETDETCISGYCIPEEE